VGLLDEEFLTVAEVAEILRLNPKTVGNWIDEMQTGNRSKVSVRLLQTSRRG
jgi:hypothetical protein